MHYLPPICHSQVLEQKWDGRSVILRVGDAHNEIMLRCSVLDKHESHNGLSKANRTTEALLYDGF